MTVFGSASLINLMVSVDVKPHERRSALLVCVYIYIYIDI